MARTPETDDERIAREYQVGKELNDDTERPESKDAGDADADGRQRKPAE